MAVVLKSDFVQKHISSMPHVPDDWDVGPGYFYQLDLKMCQIRTLDYGFKWGTGKTRRKPDSLLDVPQQILQLDLSLNDLASLDQRDLATFSQLRTLNVSLNRIDRYVGIEAAKYLRYLDLSHNRIATLHGLAACSCLVSLNLSMNLLDDVSLMPNLGQLKQLNLSNNKLTSVHGLQSLPQLQELSVQRNQLIDILPLSASLRLQILNAADNKISSLPLTLDILKALSRLRSVTLHGNPIEHDRQYRTRLHHLPNIDRVDNINIKPQFNSLKPDGTMYDIQDVTKLAFNEHLANKRHEMGKNVSYLQKRILALQDEFHEYEEKTQGDMQACLRYLDGLSVEEAHKYTRTLFPDKGPTHHSPVADAEPWHPFESKPPAASTASNNKHANTRPDFSKVKDTDEVLRLAYNELAKEHDYQEH